MKNKSIRISKVHLKNFAPTYTSMGIKDISFDRTNSKNNLVLILGENGSGKSFLLTELSPEPLEHVSGRVGNRFLDNEEGRKEITFTVSDVNGVDTDEFKSLIIYSPDHKKTTCHFSHKSLPDGEEVELNPNGNVSSYMDLCDKYLGYSKNYKNIGYLSSDVKNVVGMGYNERQQLISSWLPNTGEFLQAAKLAQKKKNQTQKEVDGLTKDIAKVLVGDIDELLKAEENKLLIKKTKLEKIKDGLSKSTLILTSLAKYSKEILRQTLDKFKADVSSYNDRYSKNANLFTKYSKYFTGNCKEKITEDLHKLDVERESLISKESNYNDELIHLTSQIEQLSINKNEVQTDYNLVSVVDSIKENETSLNNLKGLIANSKNNNQDYEEYEMFNPEFKEASSALIQMLMNIALISTKAETMCGKKTIEDVFNGKIDIDSEIETINSTITSIEKQVEDLKESIRISEENSVDFASLKSSIPSHCNETTCSLIKALIERSYDHNGSKINALKSQLESVNNNLINTKKNLEDKILLKKNIQNIMFDVGQVEDMIKQYGNNITYLPKTLKDHVMQASYVIISNTGEILDEAKKFDEFVSLLEKEKTIQDSINNLQNISKILSMTEENKKMLDKYVNRRNFISEELKTVVSRIQEINTEKQALNDLSSKISELSEEKKELQTLYESLASKQKELLEYNKTLYAKRIIENCISNLRDLEFSVEKDVNDISSIIEGYKTQLTSVEVLKTRKANLETKRDLFDLAYKVWSADGYPSLLINDFLSEVIDFTNKDLDASWGGMLNLDRFKLDNTSLKIPVIRGETILEDVNECSKAEKSTLDMAISFGIIEASTADSLYNIIRVDEIDGPMDVSRRQSFLDTLTQRLRDINCRDCYCITHSNCFETTECDVILLKGYENAVSESSLANKNVIYRYDRSI